ncbi:MAG TPA: BrxA/BrxB family bacilliredoxin [Bryobacteraceae bacterium]|jgi:putative YphP/YqiW family bacilliredoxin|nr:BrxA/BrxB family bacilliredoxin [Bryobacteraceae bacterium]
MRYSEILITPMREDLSRHGILETRTPEQVDAAISNGTVMMVINSVCGCAASKARPGVVEALRHSVRPDRAVTVFAGADLEAVARVRELASHYPPSSPSVLLFRDGKPVYYMPRHQIENRQAPDIAASLREAFEAHCVPQNQ